MKRYLTALLLGGLLTGDVVGAANDHNDVESFLREERRNATRQATTRLRLDPQRIINEANSFLKEREPEMAAEEYALHEKIESVLGEDPEFAVKILEAMQGGSEEPSPAFECILANAYYTMGEIDKAEAKYLAATTRFPTFLRAWNNLGVLYYSSERFERAIPCFAKTIELGERNSTILGLLGYCQERTGDAFAAELSYQQAVTGAPGNADWIEGLLRVSLETKQYGRAESLAKRLIQLEPADRRLWLLHASVLLAAEKRTEALVVLELAAGADIAGATELELLGDLYAAHGLQREFLDVHQKLLAVAPEIGERKLLRYAQSLTSADRLDDAGKVLETLENQGTITNRVGLLQAKADLFAAQKQWPQARAELQNLLQIDPLNGPALLRLGQAYAAENDLAHAEFAFASASQIPESQYRARLALADLALKNHRYEQAAGHLQSALKIERTDLIERLYTRVQSLIDTPATAQ